MLDGLSPSRRDGLRGAAIVVLTLAAYLPVLDGGFVWDDAAHLIENIVLEEKGLYRVWLTTESMVYYPVVWTSYWLEHQLWDLEPAGYHIVNVLLHAAGALLVWRILLRLGVPGAWLAALLFALHPVNVETAAWITQRKNTLCFVFYALSILLFLRYEDEDRGASLGYGAAIGSFLFSMLSKGAGATLPFVLLLLAWWRRGRITRRDLSNALPFLAVSICISLLEIGFQYGNAIGAEVVHQEGLAARLAGAGWIACFYLYKALWPLSLSFVYPRWEVDPGDPVAWLPTLLVALAFFLCWRMRQRWGRAPLTVLAYFLLALAPVLGFFDFYYMMYSLVGDHYQYVAIVAVIAGAVGGATALAARLAAAPRRGLAAASTLVILFFFALTWQRSTVFADGETLWRDAIAKNPDAFLAHYNLGIILQDRGAHQEAAHHYRAVLRTRPYSERARNNLGSALLATGALDEAIAQFELAIRSRPDSVEAHNNLGNALRDAGRLEEAEDRYRHCIALDPSVAAAHRNLAGVLRMQGRYAEAKRELGAARRLKAATAP
ncbi:MAG: tetratricopeptide repeat protein [Deltaproteobacteria bacterium]|nr:tetratricopeptide repeat protein [Deltaproteobacteria bacterium]